MEKKKPFHITITRNETGETLHDYDTDCIIGAVNLGETTACIGMAEQCTGGDLACVLSGAEETVQEFKNDDPMLALLVEISKHRGTHDDKPEEAQPEENEVEP